PICWSAMPRKIFPNEKNCPSWVALVASGLRYGRAENGEASMKCAFCSVPLAKSRNRETTDEYTDALRPSVKRLIGRDNAWRFARPCCPNESELWLMSSAPVLQPSVSGGARC